MNVAVIGKGRVATHLIMALRQAGHSVTECGGRMRRCPVPQDADVVLIAIKDDAISLVADELKDSTALVVHTAGSVDMDVISSAHRGVLYPMQTFSMGRKVNFQKIPLFIEASGDKDLQTLRTLALSLSPKVTVLDSQRRKTLHLAAVLCCNFVNHMYDLTDKVLGESGIPFEVMLPLIDETAAKVHDMSPHEAQTGPAIRWDETVIKRHLSMLTNPTTKDIYSLISKSIHDLK